MSISRLFAWIFVITTCFAITGWSGAVLKLNGSDAMPIFTRSVTASAVISGQFAKTTLVMVFQNESTEQIEADFIYALPPGAVATYFAYWAGDEKVEAKIVEKKEAAAIYKKLTTIVRDPALIEFKNKNTFRARISPVFANQDLKVEIQYVQVLPSSGNYVRYSVPIGPASSEQTDPLESVNATIQIVSDSVLTKDNKLYDGVRTIENNYGLPGMTKDRSHFIVLNAKNYLPKKELAVKIGRWNGPLRAELLTEQKRGGDGYFSLALTPDRSLKHPKVSISGLITKQIVPSHLIGVKAGRNILVSGRYNGSGKAIVTLSGKTNSGNKTYSVPVDFSNAQDLGVAPKLWAADRIGALGTKKSNKKTVMKLSFDYCLPSRYTSWLAVPKSEIQRMEDESKYEANSQKIEVITKRMADMIVEGKQDSPEYRSLDAQYEALRTPISEENDYKWELCSNLEQKKYKAVQDIIEARYAENPDANKESQCVEKANRLFDALHSFSPYYKQSTVEGTVAYEEQPWLNRKCHDLARKLIQIQLEGKSDTEESKRVQMQYSQLHALLKSPWDTVSYESEATYIADNLAYELVSKRIKPKSSKAELIKLQEKLDRLAAISKIDTDALIKAKERQQATYKSGSLTYHYAKAIAEGRSKEAADLLKKFRVYSKVSNRSEYADEDIKCALQSEYSYYVSDYYYEKSHGIKPTVLKEIKQKGIRLGKATGQSFDKSVKDYQIKFEHREKCRQTANQMYNKAILLTDELYREHPFKSRVDRLRKETGTLASNLDRINKDSDDAKSAQIYIHDADITISAWLEEQKVKSQVLDGTSTEEKLDEAVELRKAKTDELCARLRAIGRSVRGGDPLISVDAPEDAKRVIATLPDGDVKNLEWNPTSRRWEARFDVPTGTPDGDYVVTVVAMLSDGTRKTTTVNYKVDNTAPSGVGSAVSNQENLRLEIKPNEEVARVVALLPWGERVELNKSVSENGVYKTSVQVPASAALGTIEFVLTDNAHNRGSIFVEPTNP